MTGIVGQMQIWSVVVVAAEYRMSVMSGAAGLVVPLFSLAVAMAVSGLLLAALGIAPWPAFTTLIDGAFGYPEAWGYTLYYATSFIFAGLAVALPFRAGLFNIGGEGQATLGGLGAGLAALALPHGPWPLVAVAGVMLAAGLAAAWAMVPGWLQGWRGSHIVITTIMFNFLAAALMTWLMVDVLIAPGQQSPESAPFAPETWLPGVHVAAGWLGISLPASPLNLSFGLALVCCAGVWLLVDHTRWGFTVRVAGANPRAAAYAGISTRRTTLVVLLLAGALAGGVGVNEILGVQHKLLLGFTSGVGYAGIAVALMGRNHPLGVALAALLFGALYQGGTELSFVHPEINRELVVAVQGLAVLFVGAFERLPRVVGMRKAGPGLVSGA